MCSREILSKVTGVWDVLMAECQEKKKKLAEAYQEMLYNRGVTELENWISQIEVLIKQKINTQVE